MKTSVLAGLAGSLVIAGAASASFTGWAGHAYLTDANGNVLTGGEALNAVYSIIDLYATFDSAGQVVLNTINSNITSTAAWVHNNGGPDSMSPNAFFGSPGENPATDSFLLIGGTTGEFGAGNSTQFDPDYGLTANTVVGGWFNGNPPNLQGLAVEGAGGFAFATWVGRFVIEAPGAADGDAPTLSGSMGLTWNQGLGTPPLQAFNSEFSVAYALIPAPGAVALLGLAGLAGTRRRRA